MGKKGESKHLKRFPAPRFWPIHVKEDKWTVKPSSGPHPNETCLPLLIIIRDTLKYAKTAKEARKIISEGKVRVDGKIRKHYRYPAGLMDVVEIPELDKTYRLLPSPSKGLILIEIPKKEATFKLCRIEDKTTVKGGHIQLNLHDGRNLVVKIGDPLKPREDAYKVRDTLKIELPTQNIIGHHKFEEGSYVTVLAGANQGKVGRVKSLIPGTATKSALVSVETAQGDVFQTTANYTFTIGNEKPELTLPIQT